MSMNRKRDVKTDKADDVRFEVLTDNLLIYEALIRISTA